MFACSRAPLNSPSAGWRRCRIRRRTRARWPRFLSGAAPGAVPASSPYMRSDVTTQRSGSTLRAERAKNVRVSDLISIVNKPSHYEDDGRSSFVTRAVDRCAPSQASTTATAQVWRRRGRSLKMHKANTSFHVHEIAQILFYNMKCDG